VNVRHLDGDDARATASSTLSHALGVVVRHPTLWWPASRAIARFAPARWWRHPPFLPAPDERYWRFRMETAYGDAGASPSDDDVAVALRWSLHARARRR
jgi:hypothetical protein